MTPSSATASATPRLELLAPIAASDLLASLAAALPGAGDCLQLRGLHGSLKGILLARLHERMARQVIYIAADTEAAQEAWSDIALLLGEERALYIGDRYSRVQKKIRNIESTFAENADALRSLTEDPVRFVVTDIRTVARDFPSVRDIREQSVHLRLGPGIEQLELVKRLSFGGFEQTEFVSTTGEFALRGGIVDVFPVGFDNPLRIEFFGDDIESIREFDPLSQRSIRHMEHVAFVASLFLDGEEAEHSAMPDFFATDAVLVFDGLEQITQSIDESDLPLRLRDRFTSLVFSVLPQDCAAVFPVESESQPAMNGSIRQLQETLVQLAERGFTTHLVADSPEQAQRLEDLLHSATEDSEDELPASPPLDYQIHYCPLTEGFILPALKLAVLTEHQVFNRRHIQKRASKGVKGLSLREMKALRIGDYVVHADKGIGKFIGFETITVNGGLQETAKLVYADDDTLYVNLNYINKLQKYSSEEGHVPQLSKLGTGAWEKLRAKTKKHLKDIARDLIQLYAKRKLSDGHAFSPDGAWQKEMEASFMYEDTPDQAKATAEVKRDMEDAVPMDRLVCGDVGYGKTEVAVRAAFKAVVDGKQVAVLVPTTILAQQHYHTFRDRLHRYSVMVESLSRFKTIKEQKEVTGKLLRGGVDVVIGTHRLLSKDVAFKNLGLLIVDEEHRFGVAAKEKLRQLRANVDTLTMTATPIPRTLNFSLLGARDLSVIETPPKNRLPIITHILPFEEETILEGVERELQRGGQVFFVNDKVKDLELLADQLRVMLPGVRISSAHGQMKPAELERVMMRFMEKKVDILVATKIVESGLDIPNANTIFINRAHHFGLAELYQLRGRVGRSNTQAYAYLLIPPEAKFSKDALKRLQAIEEFSELGTGFQLAMRDLEIRGAGNLLGAEQSGFITEIGFDLYMATLEEAVQELKEQEFAGLFPEEEKALRPRADVVMELGLDAYLPHGYVRNATERFDLYKRLYNCESDAEIDEIEAEIIDRFGQLPVEAKDLLFSVRVRLIAARIRLARVTLEQSRLNMALPPPDDTRFYETNFQPLMAWVLSNRDRAKMEQDSRQVRIIVNNISHPLEVEEVMLEMENVVLEDGNMD
ncbi:MAG: transcription-repair coupling factor [Bacteroidota bacterium]|jgi:transcription-repair coupling factor (superfamily II helicase)|nr:transcription-repair coupling factor [Bacteroidota bacterium]